MYGKGMNWQIFLNACVLCKYCGKMVYRGHLYYCCEVFVEDHIHPQTKMFHSAIALLNIIFLRSIMFTISWFPMQYLLNIVYRVYIKFCLICCLHIVILHMTLSMEVILLGMEYARQNTLLAARNPTRQ